MTMTDTETRIAEIRERAAWPETRGVQLHVLKADRDFLLTEVERLRHFERAAIGVTRVHRTAPGQPGKTLVDTGAYSRLFAVTKLHAAKEPTDA
jgi:hypothetical protein